MVFGNLPYPIYNLSCLEIIPQIEYVFRLRRFRFQNPFSWFNRVFVNPFFLIILSVAFVCIILVSHETFYHKPSVTDVNRYRIVLFSFTFPLSSDNSIFRCQLFCFTWNLRFSTLPDVFLVSSSMYPCFLPFYVPFVLLFDREGGISAFCRRRCFLCIVSHETLCILLSRLSYFLFILILSSFYFLFNRWSGISAFCRSYCLLALFHMKHFGFFYIWLAYFVSLLVLSSYVFLRSPDPSTHLWKK